MEIFLKEFQEDNINVQQLFATAVYYNNEMDVKYLLQQYPYPMIDINSNNFFALRHCGKTNNIRMINILISYGDSLRRMGVPMNLIYEIPFLITYIMPMLHREKTITKDIALRFMNIAIAANNRLIFKCLIDNDLEDFISDYRYVIVASGAGRIDILNHYDLTFREVADECFETALKCHNEECVNYIKPFLNDKVVESV